MNVLWRVWVAVITLQVFTTRMAVREMAKQLKELRGRINALDRHTHHGLYADRRCQP